MGWIAEFEENPSKEALSEAFNNVIGNEEFIDSDEGCIALAAAEIVAAIKGNKSDKYPEDTPDFGSIEISGSLIALAIKAVDRVSNAKESELKLLWEESDEMENWLEEVTSLKERLA
jgi:hypothetical protein